MSANPVSTFGVFVQLLTRSVNDDASLDEATKVSMLSRLADLARDVGITLDYSEVETVAGSVSLDELNKSIEVATGSIGNNRVVWNLMKFSVPLHINGSLGTKGFLVGHTGASPNAAVAEDDISLEYRFDSNETFKRFDRNTVLEGVTSIQFAAAIVDLQGSDAALPGISLIARQV